MRRQDKIYCVAQLTEIYIKLNVVSGYHADGVRNEIAKLVEQLTKEAMKEDTEKEADYPTATDSIF